MKWYFLQIFTRKSKSVYDIPVKVQTFNEGEQNNGITKTLIDNGINKAVSKDFSGAINDFNKAIEIDPNNMDAYIQRSKAKKILNDDKGAKQDIKIARVLLDKLDTGLKANEMATEKFNADDFKGAIEYFSKSIALNVITSGTYYYRGLSKKYINDFTGAIEDFNKVIEFNPDYTIAYHERGKIKYHKFNDCHGALSDYNKAIQLTPNDEELYISRAMLKSTMENPEDAIQDYNKAIELNSSNTQNHFSRAMRKFEIQEYTSAIEDLDIVIELGLPEDADVTLFDAYSLRAGFKVFISDFEGAVNDYSKALEYEPNNGKIYFERAEVRIILGQTELGLEDKLKAYQLEYEGED